MANLGAVSVRSYRLVALEGGQAKYSFRRNLAGLLGGAYVMSVCSFDESEMTKREVAGTVAQQRHRSMSPSSLSASSSPAALQEAHIPTAH